MKAITRRGFTAAGIVAALGLAEAFAASCNRPTAVYGPPEDFEPDDNIPETVYGPPEDLGYEEIEYVPDENEIAGVYGPPDDYEPVAAPSDEEPSE